MSKLHRYKTFIPFTYQIHPATMLEFFAYKKFKKHKAEKEEQSQAQKSSVAEPDGQTPKVAAAAADESPSDQEVVSPILTDDDERFLERLTVSSINTEHDDDDDDEGPRPPLPPRVGTPDLSWDSDSESFRGPKDKTESAKAGLKAAGKKANRLSLFLRRDKKGQKEPELDPTRLVVPAPEVDHERDDLARVLDNLNLSAKNNTAFSLSDESTELVRRFTLVLKDLVNGVPTAVNDLTSLLDDKDGILAKNYDKLPKSVKKLVTQLPDKLGDKLGATEILTAAAAAGGLEQDANASKKGGLKGTAKSFLVPKNLAEMVTKPGAIVSMLKGIMNALKLRWPAFIGTNVLWSVAIFSKFSIYDPEPRLVNSIVTCVC